MYEKGKEIKKLNDNNNKFNLLEKEDKEENEKNNKNTEYIGEKKYILRKVKTTKETNKINKENSINESGLVNHIKEVLKGESVHKLMNKLDFTKAVTMKHKLEIFNKK